MSASVVARVARAQLLTMGVAMALVVCVGTLAGGITTLRREDAVSLGVARVVRAEIAEHQHQGAALDQLLREEIAEQEGMGRAIEVWQGRVRLGGDGAALLGPTPRQSGRCATERRVGHRLRVCALLAPADMQVVVALHLEPLVRTLLTVSAVMAAIAAASILGLFWIGRRLTRRLLRPLSTFGERIAAMRADRTDERLPATWGAREIDALAAAFNELLGRIDEALGRERRFLLDISHELRSPLSRLQAQLDLLIEESTDPALATSLPRAAAACAGLVRLTESVLALGRSEVPAGEAVNLGDLLRAHHAEVRGEQPAQAARIRIEAPDEVLLRADPSLVRLCLANLIDNALKFSAGPVVASVSEEGAAVLLAIEDRGPGIPDDEIGQVGEPFFRGRGRGRIPGSGLGLALVRHVVQKYGGTVTLLRPAPGGLRVEIRLPAWQPR